MNPQSEDLHAKGPKIKFYNEKVLEAKICVLRTKVLEAKTYMSRKALSMCIESGGGSQSPNIKMPRRL